VYGAHPTLDVVSARAARLIDGAATIAPTEISAPKKLTREKHRFYAAFSDFGDMIR
jgi:hypothetical protein